jgi:hypothetical protein
VSSNFALQQGYPKSGIDPAEKRMCKSMCGRNYLIISHFSTPVCRGCFSVHVGKTLPTQSSSLDGDHSLILGENFAQQPQFTITIKPHQSNIPRILCIFRAVLDWISGVTRNFPLQYRRRHGVLDYVIKLTSNRTGGMEDNQRNWRRRKIHPANENTECHHRDLHKK